MTEDTLTKGESALLAIRNLGALQNNITGSIQTINGQNPQIPGLDPLIAEAFRYGCLQPSDLLPYATALSGAVKRKQDEFQAIFDAL